MGHFFHITNMFYGVFVQSWKLVGFKLPKLLLDNLMMQSHIDRFLDICLVLENILESVEYERHPVATGSVEGGGEQVGGPWGEQGEEQALKNHKKYQFIVMCLF